MLQHSKQLRVFVVDDAFITGSTLELILRQKGFDALSFHAPLDALEAARSQAPDFLISDVVMPRLSGIELAIRIREHSPDCKVLLFSGHAAAADLLQSARERGHDFEFISRPMHPIDLLRKIEEATGHLQ